jgi:hypothetical protein
MFARKRLIVVAVFCFLSASCWAQNNELSLTAGGMKTSGSGTQVCEAILNCTPSSFFNIDTGGAFQAAFAHRVADFKVATAYVELPLIVSPTRGTPSGNISSLFFTPSVKFKLLPSAGVSPFLSIGLGLGHFNVNSTSSNVVGAQLGGGADFRTRVPLLGIRVELRDIISGDPSFGPGGGAPSALRQNVFVGGGVVLKFGRK